MVAQDTTFFAGGTPSRAPARPPAWEEHLRYWTGQLGGASGPELPADRSRPAGGRSFATHPLEFGAPLDLAVAAVQVVLARYTGTPDVAVATVADSSVVVLRSRVAGAFPDFLRAVRATVADAYAHAAVPFEDVVEELGLDWDLARVAVVSGGAAAPPVCDLVVRITGRTGAVEYHSGLFEPTTIERFAGHLGRVLATVAADPAVRVDAIDILAEPERDRLLVEFNDTGCRFPAGTVAGLFAAQVRRAPGAAALVADGIELSYAELDARANALAHRLVALGVGVEDRVGVLVERSPDLVVAVLAVVKAGGAYVPIDVRAPAERMRLVLAEAGASVLLTDRTWEPTGATVHSGPVVVVGGESSPGSLSTEPPAVAVHPDNLVYVEYTSGSTGVPKGVAVRHRDVVALAFDPLFSDAHERVLVHSPLAFDASTYELWVPLLRGGQVVVAPPSDVDVDMLRRMIGEYGVTGLWLTSGLFRMVAQDAPDCLAGLREVWTGGDVVPADAVRRVLAACPGLVVVDGYGPTETTTFATSYRMPDAGSVPDTVPIGSPVANMRVYVLDAMLRPVPVGLPGELYIAGAGLSRGYLGRPGLTAQRFVACPFGGSGERMYRTGDVVRWDAAGDIEFMSRVDDQVKIRGFRVELGEIETALLGHDTVAETIVVVRPDDSGRKRLVAYVVPAPGAAADPAALRAFLNGRCRTTWCRPRSSRWTRCR